LTGVALAAFNSYERHSARLVGINPLIGEQRKPRAVLG
jgi:hypothetical protein